MALLLEKSMLGSHHHWKGYGGNQGLYIVPSSLNVQSTTPWSNATGCLRRRSLSACRFQLVFRV